jgi:hypothetical protein
MAVKKKKKTPAKKKAANVEAPASPSAGEVTISARKIKNGWVIREEKVIRGRYTAIETFTKTKPVFAITT